MPDAPLPPSVSPDSLEPRVRPVVEALQGPDVIIESATMQPVDDDTFLPIALTVRARGQAGVIQFVKALRRIPTLVDLKANDAQIEVELPCWTPPTRTESVEFYLEVFSSEATAPPPSFSLALAAALERGGKRSADDLHIVRGDRPDAKLTGLDPAFAPLVDALTGPANVVLSVQREENAVLACVAVHGTESAHEFARVGNRLYDELIREVEVQQRIRWQPWRLPSWDLDAFPEWPLFELAIWDSGPGPDASKLRRVAELARKYMTDGSAAHSR